MTDRIPNTRGSFTMSFEAADILIMADALSIGSATAMMSPGGCAADHRLRKLRDEFLARSPLPKSNRSEGYEWFAACRAVTKAGYFEVFAAQTGRSYDRENKRNLVIDVDGKLFAVCEDLDRQEAEASVSEVSDFVSEVSGVDTQRLVPLEAKVFFPDDGHKWRNEIEAAQGAADALAAVMADHGITHVLRKAKQSWENHGDRDAADIIVSVPRNSVQKAKELLEAAFEAARQAGMSI